MHTNEFGSYAISKIFARDTGTRAQQQKTSERFSKIIDMFEGDPLSWRTEQKRRCATTIRDYPEIVLQFSFNDELASILYQAAAGPAKDKRLFELVVQLRSNEMLLRGKDKPIHDCIRLGDVK